MKRGDVVIVADRSAGDFGGKPRPAVVVQADMFAHHPSVTICLITTRVRGYGLFRVPVPASEATGLLEDSEVSVDKTQTVWVQRVGRRIGRLSDEHMSAVGDALRRWLAL